MRTSSKRIRVKTVPIKNLFTLLEFLRNIDNEQRRDTAALITMAVCAILTSMGYNSYITATLLVVSGYYFGRRNIAQNK